MNRSYCFTLQAFALSMSILVIVERPVRAEVPGAGKATDRYVWNRIDKKHWQAISSDPSEPTAETDQREGTRGRCLPGMVDIQGEYRLAPDGTDTDNQIDKLQDSTCTDWWRTPSFPDRCRSFDKGQWLAIVSKLPTKSLAYCIDRFEYPNVRGQNPYVLVTYLESDALCKKQGKRICTESEWTFACEGPEAMPYPTGYIRADANCVLDRTWYAFSPDALAGRSSERTRNEIDRLWQGEPSGSRAACKSVFGVYDQVGNIDEWTRNLWPQKNQSILKGGFWAPTRGRCRAVTRFHNDQFAAYQQGFRCCAARETSSDGGALSADANATDVRAHEHDAAHSPPSGGSADRTSENAPASGSPSRASSPAPRANSTVPAAHYRCEVGSDTSVLSGFLAWVALIARRVRRSPRSSSATCDPSQKRRRLAKHTSKKFIGTSPSGAHRQQTSLRG
jgi:formylglycine-generating enzyme